MGSVEEWTDPYLSMYCRVPLLGDGVCRICHGGPFAGEDVCHSCRSVTAQVSHPAHAIVPISICEGYGQLHTVLRQYKDGGSDSTRRKFGLQLAATVARFLRGHRECMALATEADFDLVCAVPSSGDRQGTHPLVDVINKVGAVRALVRPGLVRGPGPLGHAAPSDEGYTVSESVSGRHVLLVEDTFTTGSRCQSAASALTLAGAASVRVLVVGRYMTPYNKACQAILDAGAETPFNFSECCLVEHS